jgi:hypothetical protein
MQHDVDTVATPLRVHLLGVNDAGQEGDNPLMCAGRTLPWLQDTPAAQVWARWQASIEDVVVVDADNKIIRTYTLAGHTLADSANYAELRTIMLDAARTVSTSAFRSSR